MNREELAQGIEAWGWIWFSAVIFWGYANLMGGLFDIHSLEFLTGLYWLTSIVGQWFMKGV